MSARFARKVLVAKRDELAAYVAEGYGGKTIPDYNSAVRDLSFVVQALALDKLATTKGSKRRGKVR